MDAIFLKGAQAALVANQFGLHTAIDAGSHPEPLIRSNNGTPRILTVDINLLDQHFDSAVRIVEQVLRAEQQAELKRRFNADKNRRQLTREFGVDRENIDRYASFAERLHRSNNKS
ncbi:hypothetical protein PQR71_24895 [Paraburkholderia fungorum]|uniref:hypothetical protein n=1 Tax=Paraburkholderia fungorum TaxID=134537 RepID=UPI0038BDF3F7